MRVSTLFAQGTTLLDRRFIINKILGSGSTGVVYEAFDTKRDGVVALKHLSVVDASSIYCLKHEFRALVDVDHPNLVKLHELFIETNQWFYTMEPIYGDTLLNQLGPSPDELRLRNVFCQLASGIQAIHRAGKIHRDLKPGNVLLTNENRVVILDYGLVCDRQIGGIGQTMIDERISGTPAYMAPEQAAGKPLSTATDWYAFGVVLFEALTGESPFEGPTRWILNCKQQVDAPKASSIRKGIPKDLENLCVELLKRDPDDRASVDTIMQLLGTDKALSYVPANLEKGTSLIGRFRELVALQRALNATNKGKPVVAFVHGQAGIGKSRLVGLFLDRLRDKHKAVVLNGRCHKRESVPFKACDALIDSLSRYLRQLPRERTYNILPRKIHALASAFPSLQRLDGLNKIKRRWPFPTNPNELRSTVFVALKELIANIAEQEPLVLHVDDLQWSDVEGAELLAYILSPPQAPPLLLIGSYRREDAFRSPGLNVLYDSFVDRQDIEFLEIEISGRPPFGNPSTI